MDDWKDVSYSSILEEWAKNTVDHNGNMDSDLEKMWPAALKRAKQLESSSETYRAKSQEWLQSHKGCIFMSTVALHAALFGEIICSILALIGWKDTQEDRTLIEEKQKAKERDLFEDSSDSSDVRYDGFVGDEMDESFDVGKKNLTLSFLRGLTSWGDDNWIHKVYKNISLCREVSFKFYNIFGNEATENELFTVTVDCFIKNLRKGDKAQYLTGCVKGKGNSLVIASTVAVMLAHWKIGFIQMECLSKSLFPSYSKFHQYFSTSKPIFES